MTRLPSISPGRQLVVLGLTALVLAASIPTTGAVVCARGVDRAGCVAPHGAVVVRRPIHPYPVSHHGCYWRAGVRIRR